MPWRAVGARRAGTLPIAETSAEPEWFLLRLPGEAGHREAAVVPILRRQGGLLLGMSIGLLTQEELDAGAIEGVTQTLGPTLLTSIEAIPDDEEGEAEEVEILMLDWPAACYRHLLGGGATPNWSPNVVWPHDAEAVFHNLNYEQLVAAVRDWVNTGKGPSSEAYHTATEPPPPLVNKLQGDLDAV